MNYQLLSELKTKVAAGEIAIETALDKLYQAGLAEIGRVYDQYHAVGTPATEMAAEAPPTE